jgi:di/tricarboxylate transporter
MTKEKEKWKDKVSSKTFLKEEKFLTVAFVLIVGLFGIGCYLFYIQATYPGEFCNSTYLDRVAMILTAFIGVVVAVLILKLKYEERKVN